MENDLLTYFNSSQGQRWNGGGFDRRYEAANKYSWAVPTDEALDVIAQYGPIIEIGAGTGYWAALLQDRGVEVKAYDKHPVETGHNWYHRINKSFTTVLPGRSRNVKRFPKHTLLLCWPPWDEEFAFDCVRKYRGQHIIYIGEGPRGMTGDAKFHSYMYKNFDVIQRVGIPQWYGVHDGLEVCKRIDTQV